MPYSTLADIYPLQLDEDNLIQITNDDNNADAIVEDVVTRAIADADATIDAYCQGRYTVPLTPVPDKIRQISVDIAIYNLYSRRADMMPDNRRKRYEDAISFLSAVAGGKIKLGADTPAQVNAADTVNITGNARIFSRTKMEGF